MTAAKAAAVDMLKREGLAALIGLLTESLTMCEKAAVLESFHLLAV